MLRRIPTFAALILIGCGSSSTDTSDSPGETPSNGDPVGVGGTSESTGGGAQSSGASGSLAQSAGASGAGGASSGGSGGSGSAGSSGGSGGGKGGSGPGGAGGSGGGVVMPVEKCTAAPARGLPEAAPKLTPGTWANISPKQVPWDQSNTQGMAIDPCNPAVLYLCACSNSQTANRGVYKTTDAGATWNKVGHLDTPLHVRVDPKDGNHLYANDGVWGNTQGFFVSKDGGNTFIKPAGWTAVAKEQSMFIEDTYDVVADPADFQHLLVTFHSAWGWTDTKWNTNAGVLESNDGGDTWIVHPPQPGWGAGHAINFLYRPDLGIGDRNTWLLGAQGAGFWRTSDAGKTWNKVSDQGIQHGGGTIYYTKTGVLYASGANQNMRSTDNGVTWTAVGPGGGYNGIWGDGKNIYSGKCFGPAPYITTAESDGKTWKDFNAQQFKAGPFELGFDAVNGIMYSASWGSGMWALKPE